jgi:predicted SnoaL-like aldol condensation-catalyzing enzyme
MSEQSKRVIRRLLEEMFEQGNLEAADDLVHADFVNHEAPPGSPQGPEGLKETVAWLRGLWGRIEGGKVIEHWSVRDDLGQALQLGLVG